MHTGILPVFGGMRHCHENTRDWHSVFDEASNNAPKDVSPPIEIQNLSVPPVQLPALTCMHSPAPIRLSLKLVLQVSKIV